MRISTIQAYNNSVGGLQKNYGSVTRTQEQISTGKRILTPADDPVASVRLLQLSQEQSLNDQYKSNITAAKNSLTTQESILSSVGNVIQRIREIAVEAVFGRAVHDHVRITRARRRRPCRRVDPGRVGSALAAVDGGDLVAAGERDLDGRTADVAGPAEHEQSHAPILAGPTNDAPAESAVSSGRGAICLTPTKEDA